jgi:hypothetical protein
MVSHRLFSISAVFGGKNSKEIAGLFDGCGFVEVSVMVAQNLARPVTLAWEDLK